MKLILAEHIVNEIENLIEVKIALAIENKDSYAEMSDIKLRLMNRVDLIKEELAKKLTALEE
jgi:hypothetical protein